MANLRAFICVEVSREIQRSLQRIIQRLARQEPFAQQVQVRWVTPEQMHLTLCFLGEVDWNQTHQICQIARRVVQSQPPVTLSCEGLGAFPNWGQPRVIWAGAQEVEPVAGWGDRRPAQGDPSDLGDQRSQPACPQLGDISRDLVHQFLEHRFFPDTKPLVPHITLGRVVGGRSRVEGFAVDSSPELGDPDFGLQTVRELKLMSSERTAAGPVYRPIGTIPLGSALIDSP